MRSKVLLSMVVVIVSFSVACYGDPMAHWKLDGNADDSASSYDGAIQGDPQWTGGIYNQALKFDGDGDYILGAASPFDFEDATFTVAAWFKTTGNDQSIFSEMNDENGGWALVVSPQGYIRLVMRSSGTGIAYNAETASQYNDGKWYHAAAVVTTSTTDKNANSAIIYVNGEPVSISEGKNYPYLSTNLKWRIGSASYGAQYFTGDIDDVRIYNYGLDQQAIAELVPEPASLLLLSLGGILLRKRK